MGKNLIQQRRGRVHGRYNVPSHKYKGAVKYVKEIEGTAVVEELIHDPGRSAVVAKVRLEDNTTSLVLANEGMRVGQTIKLSKQRKDCVTGNILPLSTIPEGYPIYDIELTPGDGGKLVRAGGSGADVVSHNQGRTVIRLPSGKFKTLNSACRASIVIPAGGGREDKPFLKAGKKHYARRKKGRQYPVVRGVAMSAVDHPHGGGNHQHVGVNSSVSRGAPPGRKVGNIAAKRTGKR